SRRPRAPRGLPGPPPRPPAAGPDGDDQRARAPFPAVRPRPADGGGLPVRGDRRQCADLDRDLLLPRSLLVRHHRRLRRRARSGRPGQGHPPRPGRASGPGVGHPPPRLGQGQTPRRPGAAPPPGPRRGGAPTGPARPARRRERPAARPPDPSTRRPGLADAGHCHRDGQRPRTGRIPRTNAGASGDVGGWAREVLMGPEAAPGGSRPRVGLVLGAGGVLGAAWMTGALPAVQERLPCPIADVDLVRGTSAGSVLAAALRCGVSVDEMIAHQRDEAVGLLADAGVDEISGGPWPPPPALRVGSPRLLLTSLLMPYRVHPGV